MDNTLDLLEYLSNLILNYNSDIVKNFHNVELPNKDICKYIWSHDDNSYTIHNPNTACYIDKNQGLVHKLSCMFFDDDFQKHQLLYKMRTNFGYRLEKPLYSNIISLNNKQYLYTIVERPNKQIGIDYQLDILNGKVNTEYFVEFIDNTVPLLRGLFAVDEHFKSGLPCVFMLPTKRLRDDIGYFYFDFKKWMHPKNKYLSDNIDNMMYIINYCNNNTDCNLDVKYLENYILNSWMIE